MDDIYGIKKGDVHITDKFGIYGTLHGNATVADGGKLQLYGIVKGDVIVERGGVLEHWGLIEGDLLDRGGEITCNGQIAGTWHAAPTTADNEWETTHRAVPQPGDDLDNSASERAAILRMLAEQRLSPEEANALLDALGQPS